ncbi:hypothetical protein G7Y89_g10543 [Cudoniella acicularis]|uniref:PHD-type domain-containing protein n=1 Tax=Cudoniella acicularis TaxID=354080 RepID=A0A8H4RG84_9HELO|nr:hypothetical protein G7Y89_g10543 [Cudoniella acicularis]
MAPAALLPASIISSSFAPFINSSKGKNAPKVQSRSALQNDTASRLKRAARETTNLTADPPESFERHRPPPDIETGSEGGDFMSVAPSRRPIKRRTLNNREAKNRYHDDSEDYSSPTALSFQADIAPGSVSVSRAGTPNAANRPTRKAKTGSGLRVKSSPVKKKGGIVAGIPRASGERNSPMGNGASFDNNKDDNDDYCSACGGNGDIVCCDGCNRSFHYKCVDPPMIEDSLPSDAWFCNQCEARRNPRPNQYSNRGFGPLLSNLESKNPSAFHLPKEVREYFENVKTGTEGEYEEVVAPKPKGRAGYEEAPDYFRLKDSKGKPVLCHQCNGSASTPDRMIIPCSFCGLWWHLDCLEVPLAKEPPAGRQWRCPAHVDDILDVLPANLGPAHRHRRIKDLEPISPAFPRGSRNFGYIEIENDPSDAEEETGFFKEAQFGRVYKLPEQGLKLDFIAKVKQQGGGIDRHREKLNGAEKTAKANIPWAKQSIADQQAALNLAALAAGSSQLGDASLLYETVLAEAPPVVVDLLVRADSTAITKKNLPKKEKKCLAALKAWLNSIEDLDDGEDLPQHQEAAREGEAALEKPTDEVAVSKNGEDAEMTT